MPSSMCDDEVRVLVFKPNISQSEVAFNPTSYHQQNPLQPATFKLLYTCILQLPPTRPTLLPMRETDSRTPVRRRGWRTELESGMDAAGCGTGHVRCWAYAVCIS